MSMNKCVKFKRENKESLFEVSVRDAGGYDIEAKRALATSHWLSALY